MGIFPQKQCAEEKSMWFLKEQKTSYLPMHLSQFRKFLRKLTFFEGGGGLKERYVLIPKLSNCEMINKESVFLSPNSPRHALIIMEQNVPMNGTQFF
jgi:hypothetical protein